MEGYLMEPWANDIEGWMIGDELKWLYEKASQMNSVAEIGSWMGRSTYALCAGCKGTVYSIDHFKGSAEHQGDIEDRKLTPEVLYQKFRTNLAQFSNLVSLRMDSEEAAQFMHPVDMVFIDGSHTYEDFARDHRLWKPKALKLLCGHDRHQDGVPVVLEEIYGSDFKQGPCSIWYVEAAQ